MAGDSGFNIVIKAPNWLGDLVLFLPALKALRGSSSDGTLCVVGNGVARDVIALSGLAVEFVHFDRHGARSKRSKGGEGRLSGRASRVIQGQGRSHAEARPEAVTDAVETRAAGSWRQALAALRVRRWDIGVTFAESFSSALLLRLAGARRVLGYAGDCRSVFLSRALPRRKLGERPHLAREYMGLAEAAGAAPGDEVPSVSIAPGLALEARRTLEFFGVDIERPLLGLCPGAAYGPSKRWPAEHFSQAGRDLAAGGAAVAVFGTASEAALAEEVARGVPGAVSLAGRTSVLTLAACLARCSVVVANDSGAAHLAAAAGAPVVAVFGSSDPSWTRPLGEGVYVVRTRPECSPCFEMECDSGYECLTGVRPGDVVRAATLLMERSRDRRRS